MDFMFQLRRIDWGHVYCESKLIKRSEKKTLQTSGTV